MLLRWVVMQLNLTYEYNKRLKLYILILRPKFNIFWAIFIRLFLKFNTSGKNRISKTYRKS
jgi:hypothetical protein